MIRRFIAVGLIALVVPSFSVAQVEQRGAAVPQAGLNPESFYGKDATQGVYVRDSATALEKFAQAQRMERLKEWGKSADVYQEILEKYSDRVVPSQVDADNNIYQYTSVATAVQEKLARWPDEGLDVYRARYEGVAAGLMQAARRDDLAALHKVFSLYFVTDSAKAAGLRLVDLYLENGEFSAAAWLGKRMLDWHPNLLVERPKLIYRVAIAQHLSSDDAGANRSLEALQKNHADAKGSVRGVDVVLAQSLERELKATVPTAQDAAADTWPIFGGAPDRGRVSEAHGRPGARIKSIEFAKPTVKIRGAAFPEMNEFVRNDEQTRAAGAALGVMPAVDRGELYFQDGTRVYAVSLDSGRPLPGWVQTDVLDRNGQYPINFAGTPQGQQLTVTLTDDAVLAVMGQSNRIAVLQGQIAQGERTSRRLVCLDRATGKERWNVTAAQFPEEAAALRTLELNGSPLVVGDNVYIMARGGKGAQFEDCYVLCFAVATGQYRWSCYLASANIATQMWGDVMTPPDTVSHVAYSSGRLYALTNLGAVAAVDAYSGTIQWLNIYPRDGIGDPNNPMMNMRLRAQMRRGGFVDGATMAASRPWTFNPPIVQDGRVFVLPTDGKHVLVYDAGSGVEIKRLNLSDLYNADTMLGVIGERLIVAGESPVVDPPSPSRPEPNGMVLCINWQKYDAQRFSPNDASVVWPSVQSSPIRGRGFVTADSVFIPSEKQLARVGLKSGKVEQSYPSWPNAWENGEGRGNVLVTEHHVIIAGDRKVEVFTDLVVARAKLDREVAAAPKDPEPRLKYAEIMFASGESALAAQKLDEAIELLGGAGAMRVGPQRDRAFNDALTFGEKLIRETPEGPEDLPARFFDRAAAAASTPFQQVQYRRTRARLAEARKQYGEQVRLYQEILADTSMRGASVADEESGGATTAAASAERAINDVVRSAGAAAYAPFEQAAADALAALGASADASKFLEIALTYPNAKVAPRAMISAADAYEAAGKPQQAAHVLRQVLFKHATGYDKADVFEGLARQYLALGRVEVAISRLAQADRLLGDAKLRHALRLPNGAVIKDVTFGQALDALQKHDTSVATRLPDFRIRPRALRAPAAPAAGAATEPARKEASVAPFLPKTEDSVIDGVTAIAVPATEFARYDRVVAWSAELGLRVFASGSASPLLVAGDVLTAAPAGAAWVGDDLIVWSAKEVARFAGDGGGGKAAWRVEIKSLPTITVTSAGNVDAEDDDAAMQIRQNADPGLIRLRMRQQVDAQRRALQLQRLAMVQAGRFAVPPAEGPAAAADPNAPELIVEVRPAGDRVLVTTSNGRLMAVDLPTGQVAWQTRPTDRAIERLLATDDFTVVRVSDDVATRIVVFDTFGGQPVGPRRPFLPGNEQLRQERINLMNRAGIRAEGLESGQLLINLALAADGTLVYTLPDRICGKDLYDPAPGLTFEVPISPDNGSAFVGATRPDQLIIADGRILALSSVSDTGQFVRVHSLETGRPLSIAAGPNNRQIEALLSTGAKDWNVGLRFASPYLYTMSLKKIIAYNLDRPTGLGYRNIDGSAFIRDAFVGQDYLVTLDGLQDPAENPPRGSQPSFRLFAHSRASQASGESGALDHILTVTDRSGILQWQPADGGLYYVTGERKLHMLRGARQ